MSMASQDRILISGKVQFESLLDFTMNQQAGTHATATLRGILTEEGSAMLSGRLSGEVVTIMDSETGKFPPIFEGIIDEVLFSTENGLDMAEVRLKAGSILLDIERKSQSFQDVNMTYHDVIRAVVDEFETGDTIISDVISEQKIGRPIIRYRETVWEFVGRLASQYNLPIFSDIKSGNPRVYVGVPQISQPASLTDSVYTVAIGREYYAAGGPMTGLVKSDFLQYNVEDGNSYFLGWKAKFQGHDFRVCGKSARLDHDLLVYEYTVADPAFCYTPRKYNPWFNGMSLWGRVLKTDCENVWLHLDIDETQDLDKACPWLWTPETNNIMYLMPKVGERVALYFSDADEANGKAIHSVRENAPPPESKATGASTPHTTYAPSDSQPFNGKSSVFSDNSYDPGKRSLTTEDGKTMFIWPDSVGFCAPPQNLQIVDGKGIFINSSGTLGIHAGGQITLSGKTVTIAGKTQTFLSNGFLQNMIAPELPAHSYTQLTSYSDIMLEPGNQQGTGLIITEGNMTVFAAWETNSNPTIPDDPANPPDKTTWQKVGQYAEIGVVVLAVAGTVVLSVATFGGADVPLAAAWAGLSTAAQVTITVGSAVAFGLAMQGAEDLAAGRFSGAGAYVNAAIIGAAVGLIAGPISALGEISPFLEMEAAFGAGFMMGATDSAVMQEIENGEIDWNQVFYDGAVFGTLSAITEGFSRGASEFVGKLKGAPKVTPKTSPKTVLNYQPSSGITLQATPGRTTTVLGNYSQDMKYVVNELGNVKTTSIGPNDGGFNVLNVPDDLYQTPDQFWNEHNQPWLDAAIERNDIFELATPPTTDVLYNADGSLTGFGREFYHLINDYGYTFDPSIMQMIPPQ